MEGRGSNIRPKPPPPARSNLKPMNPPNSAPPKPPTTRPIKPTAGAPPTTRGRGSGIRSNSPSTNKGRGQPPLPNRSLPAVTRTRGGVRPVSKPPTSHKNSNKSDPLLSGFVSSQQLKGENANTRKFYDNILHSILQQGLNVSTSQLQTIQKITNEYSLNHSQILIPPSETTFLMSIIHQIQYFLTEQKKLKKIVQLQSTIRWWIIRKKFQKLRRSNEERQRVIKRNEKYLELLKTEKKFVASVEELISKYVIPLRQTDIIEPQEGAYLFCNIEVILTEHKTLVSKLEDARSNWPFLGNIGIIFLDIKSLLNAMSVYVGHFKTAINEISRIREEKPRFHQFIEQRAKESDFDLATMLLIPVNRVSQYELYLLDLCEFMLPDTQEKEDCEVAYSVLAQSSIVVQKSLVESGNIANMLKVQRKLKSDKGPLTVMTPGRVLKREYKFKKHYVCLFSDVILIAKKESLMKTMKTKEAKEIHKFKCMLPYKNTELKSDNKSFELKNETTTFKFVALTPEDKQDFVKNFNNIVAEINRIKVFNVSLIDTIIREESSTGIPTMLEILSNFIKTNCADQPGIFRVAGSNAEINTLKEAFDAGETDLSVLKLKEKNIFSVCDTFKLYFRALPEPLLGFSLYEPLLHIMRETKSDEDTWKEIKEAIFSWTPPFAIKVLRFLMNFLNDISKYSEENKMTSNNISIVFGPTLLWPEKNTLEAAMDMPYINSAVKVIIENYSNILN